MHRKILPYFLIFVAAACSVFAVPGEFKPSETSAKATWFAHLNIAGLRESEIGKQLLNELDGESKRQLRQFERMLSFHPIDDLESATVYGTSADPEQTVALIRGAFDRQRLTDIAKDSDAYKPVTHPKTTIHSWEDNGNRIYATIIGDKLVIIGPQLDLLRDATDVVNGDSPALKADDIFGYQKTDHAPLLVASANLSAIDGIDLDSKIVQKIKAIYISAGESRGELLAYTALKTANPRSAKLVDQMLHGVLALAEASDEVPPEIIEAFQTKLDGSGISLSVKLPLKKFKTLMAKLEKAAEGMK